MNVGSQEYVEVIRQLPRPTLGQTERFARYVSSAHSWYKHLPIRPKVPFVFFLDPGASMNRVQTRTGETALVEITDESTRFHYTWQTTQDYRRRFGFWNYHGPYGSWFLYPGEGGVVSTAGPGVQILTQSGEWVSVPPSLAEKGTALVNAFVHPDPNFSIWAHDAEADRFGLAMISNPDDARFRPPTHPVLGRLWSVLQQDRRAGGSLELIPQQILVLASSQEPGGVKELSSLLSPMGLGWPWPNDDWLKQIGESEIESGIIAWVTNLVSRWVKKLRSRFRPPLKGKDWDWPGDAWLDRLRASGVEEGFIPSVVKQLEVERVRTLTRRYRKGRQDTPQWPNAAMLAVAEGIMEERGTQLAAMTDAMDRFIAAVFLP